MKKIIILLVALTMVAGFTFAEDIGLTAGLEFGLNAVNKPNGTDDMYPYLMPYVYYENSFLDGALDLYTELDYTFGFTKDADDNFPMDLWWDLALGYNLSLGSASNLTFLAENELGIEFVEKMGDTLWGIFRPGVKFSQGIDNVGDLYGQIDVPIGYGDDDILLGLDITAGWASTFGLGLKAKAHMLFMPDYLDTGFTGIDIKATYSSGPLYGEVEFRIAKEINSYFPSSYFDGSYFKGGFAIIPKFQYTIIPNLNAYIKCAFGGIGSDGDIVISPALGVTYSF